MIHPFRAASRAMMLAAVLLNSAATGASRLKQPVDFVDPNIGGIAHQLTSLTPTVFAPHGMVELAPLPAQQLSDTYLADSIAGFPAGCLTLSPFVGKGERLQSAPVSSFDHDQEIVSPYYASYLLEDFDLRVEYTATPRAAYFRFTFPKGSTPQLLFRGGDVKFIDAETVTHTGKMRGGRSFVYARLSRPASKWTPYQAAAPAGSRRARPEPGGSAGLIAEGGSRVWEMRVGVSYIDIAQARENLELEIPHWDFERARQQSRKVWNDALSKILIEGGTEEQRTLFYTCLYRSLLRMTDITEGHRYFSPFDGRIHETEGHDFYNDDGLWDSYRCRHPLQLIIEPGRRLDMVRSYVRMFEQSGWMPVFPHMDGDRPSMVGNHAAALIADTWAKGLRDFDIEKAYAGIRKNAMEGSLLPDHKGRITELDRFYAEHGYFPSLQPGEKETAPDVNPRMHRQAVSVTLENAYDDWAISQLAKSLGKEADAAYFGRRAFNYTNLFDSSIGFMRPKTADGKWIEPYNPKRAGGQGGRDYFTECNAWIYSFHVQHDVAGLANLMGGREQLAQKIDALFGEGYDGYKFEFLSQYPDSSGLMGQYAHGNEPSFHIAYLYNHAGQPWKAQKRLRDIMKVCYTAKPLGYAGDEDSGSLSSWYVFSAIGFYPVCPGRAIYDIGSPLFEGTIIQVGNSKTFRILAPHVSAKNKYIQSAELNGKPWSRAWFDHSAMVGGGSLLLRMGEKPNKSWGSAPEVAPPSATADWNSPSP